MKIVQNYEKIVNDNYAKLYKYAFVVSCHDISAKEMVFQTLLYLTDRERPEESVFRSAHRVTEDFFLRSLRRRKSRAEVSSGVTFPVSDDLWSFLEKPAAEKEVLFLMTEAGLNRKEAADIMGIHESRLPVLSDPDRARILSLLSGIVPDDESMADAADQVFLRFSERSVSFENRLRDIRLFFDRHILWIAAALCLFCAAAALYTR